MQPVGSALESLGHPVDRVLSAAGIAASVLTDPNARVPQPSMTALWRHALETTGDSAWQTTSSDVTVSGDLAVARYVSELTITPKAGGKPATQCIK